MSWRWVDGVAVPDSVAGHPALEFCNTRAGWGSATPKEYLVDLRALRVWTQEAGLLDPSTSLPEPSGLPEPPEFPELPGLPGDELLGRAVALREALYPVLLGRGTDEQWRLVSTEAARARSLQHLEPVGPLGPSDVSDVTERIGGGRPGGSRGPAARWRLADPEHPDAVLTVIAAAAADLLVSPLSRAVSACSGEGCGWVFADPRGRRRWCSMAVCGNRAKARRHAARHP